MNFLEAIKLAQEGKEIRRSIWEDEYIIFMHDQFYWGHTGDPVSIFSDSFLTEDWEIYKEEKPKAYSFQEALKALESGKKISRFFKLAPGRKRTLRKIVNDDGSFIMYEDDGKNVYQLYKLDQLSFNYEDIVATDWIIEEL